MAQHGEPPGAPAAARVPALPGPGCGTQHSSALQQLSDMLGAPCQGFPALPAALCVTEV